MSTRFASPTQDFDPEVLIRRLRKGFLSSMGLVVAEINLLEKARKKARRSLTTKFIKRELCLINPLELRNIF